MDEDKDCYDFGETVHVYSLDEDSGSFDGDVEFVGGSVPAFPSDMEHGGRIYDGTTVHSMHGHGNAEREENVHEDRHSDLEPRKRGVWETAPLFRP